MAQEAKENFTARLNALTFAQVSANLATNVYLGAERPWAIEWLERSKEATSAEQLSLARSAAADAREANVIARSARRIAIISVIAAVTIAIAGTAVAVIVPHYWH
jgi:hypothetical protein